MKNAGIWIDTREAVLVKLMPGAAIQVMRIFSGAERKPRIAGEKSRRTQRGATGFDYARSQKNRFREELKKYYSRVKNELQGTDHIYLAGTAEAKFDLEKELKRDVNLKSKILKVESCDSLTENQIIERVRLFFEARFKTKK